MENNNSQVQTNSDSGEQIANMSCLDYFTLLWEARIVGADYVYEKTGT